MGKLPQQHISVSQINTYLRCPLQYYYRYIEGLIIPPNSALSFGKVTHKTAEDNYKQKIETKEDLPLDEMQDRWAQYWDEAAQETEFEKDEKPGQIKDEGINCITTYHKEISPNVQPVLVEEKVELSFANTDYTLLGYIDVVDENKMIIDTKTTKRTPSEDNIKKDIQLTAYSLCYQTLFEEKEAGVRLDYIVRNKKPKIVQLTANKTQDDINRFLKLVAYVVKAIENELFYPNVHNVTCSEKGCGYYHKCYREWGRKAG
mgnify:CR=1 FL=1